FPHMSPRLTSKKASGHDVQDAISWHASVLLMLSVFVVLTAFALSLWVLKVQIAQRDLATAVGLVASNLAPIEEPAKASDAFEPTSVEGVARKAIACDIPAWTSGDCTDYAYAWFIGKGHGRDFVLPSIRRSMAGIGYETSASPEWLSDGGDVLVLRMSSLPDHVAVFVADDVKLMDVTVPVPDHAVFAVRYREGTDQIDGAFAAYVKVERGDAREVVVVDLLKDEAKTVATAKRDETYWNGTDAPKVNTLTADDVVFDVYVSSDVTHEAPALKETKTVPFTF
ncbi:hypothetical protein L0Y59_03325, partial [Candidatus Uhrbacteria bacterium]|nr:hypothetical protein [Candidatus Uhrbacteria bacterium]